MAEDYTPEEKPKTGKVTLGLVLLSLVWGFIVLVLGGQ